MAPTTPEALTSAQHYAKAIALLAQAADNPRPERKGQLLAEAGIHATLSLYVADAIEIATETPTPADVEEITSADGTVLATVTTEAAPITAEEAAETLAKSSRRRRAAKPATDEAASDALADADEEGGK